LNKPRKPELEVRSVRVLDTDNYDWIGADGDAISIGFRMTKSLADVLEELGNPHPSQVYLVNDFNYNWVAHECCFDDFVNYGIAVIEFADGEEYRRQLAEYEAEMVKYNEHLKAKRVKAESKKLRDAKNKVAKLRAQLEAAQAALNRGK
jgi:hypothetical protein